MFPWLYVLVLLWCALHLLATILTVLIFAFLVQKIYNLNGEI
nr:E8 early protein [Bos taurus papillomavirus 12]